MDIGPVRRQSLIVFGSSIGVTIIGFFATIYIAHIAGAPALGGFFLLLAYAGIIGLFTEGGISGAALQRISEGKDQNEYFSAHAVVRTVLLAGTLVILFAINPLFVDLNQSGLFIWLILALIISTAAGIIATGVYGGGKVGVLQIADFVNSIVRIAAQILAVYLGYSTAGLVGGFVLGVITGLLINLRFLSLVPVMFGWHHVRSLFAFSGWAFITGLTGTLMGYADTVLVGYFLSNTEVGLYRTAFQLATMALFTMTALRTALYPKVASWWKEGGAVQVESSLARAFSFSLALAVPAALGAWVLGGELLYYLYGSPFAAAWPAMSILFAVQIVAVFLSLETMCLGALNQPRAVFRSTATGAIITILLDILLIPQFGITGAAVALFVGTLSYALTAHQSLRGIIRVSIESRTIAAIIFASLVMSGVVVLYRVVVPLTSVFRIAGAVVLGMVVYILLLLKTGPVIRDEVRDLVTGMGLPWPDR
jgi:O-antigen/teichoic acid export membrane protein